MKKSVINISFKQALSQQSRIVLRQLLQKLRVCPVSAMHLLNHRHDLPAIGLILSHKEYQ